MKYVDIVDAKEQLADLVTLLDTNPREEVYLTHCGKPIIKMVSLKEKKSNPDARRFGIAKGQFTFDDELFDSMDAEIDKMIFGGDAK